MTRARAVAAALLAAAAVGAVARSAGASSVGRLGGALAALLLAGVAVGVVRGSPWAFGLAFFLALFWLWAAVALALQGELRAVEFVGWIAWSIVMMSVTVRART